jgi:chemotaxis protein methyltransferase CheR
MTIAPAEFEYVRQMVRRRAAIVLEPGKEYLVETRLLAVAQRHGESTVSALVSRLQRHREEDLHTSVVDALTTNETSWFRDRHPFDAVADVVVPQLVAEGRADRTIRIWSAACSTGQEPYSLAMRLLDRLGSFPGWKLEILATDLSQEVLDRARRGQYTQLEINRGLPANLLVRHFERAGTGWQVSSAVQRVVSFAHLNLVAPHWPVTRADVVFCRNVLIYFDNETKTDLLARMRRVIRPGGYLFLGAAETTLGLDSTYERVRLGATTAYQVPGSSPVTAGYPERPVSRQNFTEGTRR